jgi:hypothetical protein
VICEVYLADILTWGDSEDELLVNLHKNITGLHAKRISVNPNTIFIGLEELQYVGHHLDRPGLHMTEDKLTSVKSFPLPVLNRELTSFLGLTNYFRDDVRNHSFVSTPVTIDIRGYSSKDCNHRIRWTDSSKQDFATLKDAVYNCQKLYFMDDTILYTLTQTLPIMG